MSTFLYFAPLLKPRASAIITAVCLRNSSVWSSVEHFLAEYSLITTKAMLRKLSSIEVLYDGEIGYMPMADYTVYRLAGQTLWRSFSNLLDCPSFNKWFYGLFLKLALPFNMDIENNLMLITSPLNFLALFNMIVNLRQIGYPSHWMSELLDAILSGSIRTTAQSPRNSPADQSTVEKEYPNKLLCTTPFVAEMALLSQVFATLLPFSPTSAVIPSADDIWHFIFPIPNYKNYEGATASPLALILWKEEGLDAIGPSGMFLFRDARRLLDPSWGDEVDTDFSGDRFEQLRREGILVFSSFTWDGKKKEASAWMSRTLVERLGAGKWFVGLWKTDIWIPLFGVDGMLDASHAIRGAQWVSSN